MNLRIVPTYGLGRSSAFFAALPGRPQPPVRPECSGELCCHEQDRYRPVSGGVSPDAKTTRDALGSDFSRPGPYFGSRPRIMGGYEDAKDHKTAYVSFSGAS